MNGILFLFGVLFSIAGHVLDAETLKPVAGAVVSDGQVCVLSDRNGEYRIESDSARTVFVSIPSGYEVPFDSNGMYSGFRRIDGPGTITISRLFPVRSVMKNIRCSSLETPR